MRPTASPAPVSDPCGAAHPTEEAVHCTKDTPCFLRHEQWAFTPGGQTLVAHWPNPNTPPKATGRRGGVKRPVEPPKSAGTAEDAWNEHTNGHRDGDTYEAEFDYERLNDQAKRVYSVIVGGAWWTLGEIAEITRDPEASVSARLRDLRKPRFGALTIERRSRDRERGLFEYRLVKD